MVQADPTLCAPRSEVVIVGTHFPSWYKCSWEIGPDNWIGTHFPSCYKSSWEIGPHNWIQLSGPISQLHGSSYPARFPRCICSTMENAFPKHTRVPLLGYSYPTPPPRRYCCFVCDVTRCVNLVVVLHQMELQDSERREGACL
jgi:hypothetical protein